MTHTVNTAYSSSSGDISSAVALTGDAEIALDITLVENATNAEIDVSVARSQIKSILFQADKAVTLKTNDSQNPGDTINVQAGKPWIWQYGGYQSQPLAADITALYATCTDAAELKIRILYDATP